MMVWHIIKNVKWRYGMSLGGMEHNPTLKSQSKLISYREEQIHEKDTRKKKKNRR